MSIVRRVLLKWLVLAALTTAVSGTVYLTAQQLLRQLANDPQVQMAHDAAGLLETGRTADIVAAGPPIDFSRSLAPFITVVSDDGRVLASTGQLHGAARVVPSGVLDEARRTGEDRISWRPEPGVRVAAVVVPYRGATGGFVIAGRSLDETEERVTQFAHLIGLAWALTLGGLLVLVTVTEYLMPAR